MVKKLWAIVLNFNISFSNSFSSGQTVGQFTNCTKLLPLAIINKMIPHTYMDFTLAQLTKDISTIDQNDILSEWRWLLPDVKSIFAITCMGDIFIEDKNGRILFLLYDGGDLEIVAENKAQLEICLNDEEKFDNWFLPLLFEKLIVAEKYLKANEVYSLKILGVLGGEYNVDNIEPTDISVHFSLAGQICKQIWDSPDGTKVIIKVN